MNYRRLGRTELRVSEVSLGGLFIASGGVDAGIVLVQRALELGVTYFDTAPGYWNDLSEETLGRALEGAKQPHYVSTKLRPHPSEGAAYVYNHSDYEGCPFTYDQCMRWFELSLKRLRRDYVDILYLHDPDRIGDGSLQPVFGKGRALEAMLKLKEQKAVGAIGIASLWLDYQARCIDSGAFDVVLTFNRFGLIWRDAQLQTFPFCRKHDTGIVQGTPLHQGVLAVRREEWLRDPPEWMTPREHEALAALYAIQERCGIPLAELAIRFILGNEQIGCTIPGAATIEQLEANVACSDKGPLTLDIRTEIEALGLVHEDPRRYN